MKAFATVALTLAFLGWGSAANGQTLVGFGAHAGVSIPTGGYGTTANTGFSGGLDLSVPLTTITPMLSWYTSADVAAHSVDTDDVAGGDGGYLHFPLMTGLQLDVPGLGMVRPFLTGQLGPVFSRGPDIGNATARMTTNFGFAAGGGLQVTENLYAGVKWFSLGDVDFPYNGRDDLTRSVQFLDIYVGFGVR